jgi:APA family basic amino acid/polyamine antiporter
LSPQRLLAIASIFILTWINVRGVRVAAFVQTLLTSIKVLSLVALILLGLTIGRSGVAVAANFGATFWPQGGVGLGALPLLGAAMVGALFAMDAWNNVGFAADELRRPSRDLPFAMLTGVVTVTVLYVSANVAYLNVLGIDAIANAPQDRVATAVWRPSLVHPACT